MPNALLTLFVSRVNLFAGGTFTGVVSEAGARAIDSNTNAYIDNLLQNPKAEYTELEKELQKYGYDRSQYRFKHDQTGVVPSFSGNIKIESRN